MRLLQIIKLHFFYLPSVLSNRNLFGVLYLFFIAMRASNVLFWNKAEAELVFKQWSWGLEKNPSCYCSTFAKLPGTVSPVVAPLYRMPCTTLKRPLMKWFPNKWTSATCEKLQWIHGYANLITHNFYSFTCIVRPACSSAVFPRISLVNYRSCPALLVDGPCC